MLGDIIQSGLLEKLARNLPRVQRGRQLEWPFLPTDLMPNPPLSTIHMIGLWSYMPNNTCYQEQLATICTLLMLFRVFRDALLPGLFASPAVWHYIAKHVAACVFSTGTGIFKDFESSKACISSLLSASKLLNEVVTIMAHGELVKWVSFSCQDVVWVIEQSVSAVEASHLYLEAIALRRTVAPLPVMREVESLGELYYMFASYIPYKEPECFKLLNAVPPLRKVFACYKQNRADPHTMFFENESLWIYLCRSPSCTKAQPGSVIPFKRCSGCKRATYCSQQCQRNAWRSPAAPHREICTSLWELCQSVNA
jgi:hypothetical protein